MVENFLRRFLKADKYKKHSKKFENFEQSIEELEKLTIKLQEKDQELREHYRLMEKENKILIKASRGEDFDNILTKIIETIENFYVYDELLISILTYNENNNKLYDLCSPNMGTKFINLIKDGIEFKNKNIELFMDCKNRRIQYVDDISNSYIWNEYPEIRDILIKENVKSTSTFPIIGTNNSFLGTVTLYFKDNSYQQEVYNKLLCWASKIISILIERENNQKIITQNLDDIQHKNKLLESIIDASGGYLWMKDYNHKYKFCDYTYRYRFFGQINKQKIIGKTDKDLIDEYKFRTGKNHQFREICLLTDNHCFELRDQCRYIEGGYINGDLLIFEVIKTPLFDLNGKYKGIVGFSWDRSEEKDIVFKDIYQLEEENRIEILSDEEYPNTPFIYYIKPNKKYFKRLISRPIYDDSSIIDKRTIVEECF